MRTIVLIMAWLLGAACAMAQGCPPGPDFSREHAALMRDLKAAPDETRANLVADRIWRLWTSAPDEHAQELLDRGMERREAYDFEEAEAQFDALVAYCPAYAEGYNQRAFIRFLREKYDESLDDLDRTLEIAPDHFAALSGRALVLIRQGRPELAQQALRRAVALHPWIRERHLLKKPVGIDL